MMKRIHSAVLVGILVGSLGCSTSNARAGSHDGFIAGACAIGAALFGVAGAVALVDWCCSETDEQLIARVNGEYCSLYAQYYQTMIYFGQISGMNYYVSTPYKPYNAISEQALYDFATCIWNSNSTQRAYRSKVHSAKEQLKSCVQSLRKRAHALEGKCCKYEDQQRLRIMRKLLNETEELLSNITLFADCLDHHKTYFNLYDSVHTIRTRYIQEITILESGRYSITAEIKNYIMHCDSGQYAFRTFVNNIENDIATLRSDIRSLEYNYDAGRDYAHGLVNRLSEIKNIVITDPRYQHELYQWEQARLQKLQLEALEAQARAERQRANAMYEQNRILNERNMIERQKMQQARHCQIKPSADIWIDIVV
jgi:hypothetical protein